MYNNLRKNNLRKNLQLLLNSSFIIYNSYYSKQHLNAIPELLFPKKYVPPLIKYLPGCN